MKANRNRIEVNTMYTHSHNPIRTVVAALLGAAFALAGTAAPAMSPSEHDTMTRAELARLHGEDKDARSDRDPRREDLVHVDGKVGVIEVPSRVD